MPVTEMNHFTVLTDDLERTRAFYVGLLGLREGPRPPLGFPGAWLYAGERPVLHVIAGRALPEERRGVLDHMAFSATDLAGITGKLETAGIAYDLHQQPESKVWQLFLFDPNGARVELDFEPGDAPRPLS
jgi:catechol 2,3-dioxygenase-like lactoylglutathione lyase family enzyme